MHRTLYIFGILSGFFFWIGLLHASDLTSTNFIIRDPVVGTGGGYGTSASFSLISAGNMLLSGIGTSASFIGHNGFLYYPFVTDVTLTATPNGADADLSWPAATSAEGLGWTVSGYKTGIASVSGGPYTYTSVGNVTSYSYEDLPPGNYCFVLQTLDDLSYVIATSDEQCITIAPTLTFANNDAAIGFGTLSTTAARYANAAADGSASSVVANTLTISTNAQDGYTLTYKGASLTSGAYTIAPATISGDPDGSFGTSQFALAAAITGTGSVASGYEQASDNWKFIANTTSTIASASAPVAGDSVAMRYIGNISGSQQAGAYSTSLELVVTGNF